MIAAALLALGGEFDSPARAGQPESPLSPAVQAMLDAKNDLDARALAALQAGRPEEAERLYRQALARHEEQAGPKAPATLASVHSLGAVLLARGRYAEAEKLLQRAMASRRERLGKGHPATLASMTSLATALSRQFRYAAAIPLYQEALRGQMAAQGRDAPATLLALSGLAIALRFDGRLQEAEVHARWELDSRERVSGADHPQTLFAALQLAELVQAPGPLPGSRAPERAGDRGSGAAARRRPSRHLSALSLQATLFIEQGRFVDAVRSWSGSCRYDGAAGGSGRE
jgi:tetratricopeptide (TPR) repeat protein